MAAGAHFGCPKITFDCISGHFRSISHFGFQTFTFDRISGHFRSIQNFFVFFRRPFWMSENHFRSHFWPFHLTKWPPVAILDGTTMSIIELVRDIWTRKSINLFQFASFYTVLSKTIYGEDGTASPFACNNFVVSPPCGAHGKQ